MKIQKIYKFTDKSKNMPLGAVLAAAAPIIAPLAQNILQGINTRKARLYDSPKEQVKRFQEAGLPMASTSRITTGGGFTTQANIPDPSPSIQANLGASLKREIDRKAIKLAEQEILEKTASAKIAAGLAANKLAPTGTFMPTNQGMGYQQELQAGATSIAATQAATKATEIANYFAPSEKAIGLQKSQMEINELSTKIANNLQTNKILISEASIKNILAQYQPSMSQLEKDRLILTNAGQTTANERAEIQRYIESTMKESTMSKMQWETDITSQEFQRMMMTNDNLKKQFQSYDQWFEAKKKVDEAVRTKKLWSPADIKAFFYTLLYNPTPSGANMSPIGTATQFIPK